MRVEKCEKCQKRYSVTEIGGHFPGSKESEDITCPHCGNTYTEHSNGAFKTSPLPDEADLPLHHLLFLKLRDGGGAAKVAPGVAELHGITLEELKAQCRLAAEELIAERGHLLVYEEPVLAWAKS